MPKAFSLALAFIMVVCAFEVCAAYTEGPVLVARNPFYLPDETVKSTDESATLEPMDLNMVRALSLEGIFISSRERIALINGDIVRVGDRLDQGMEIVKISESKVYLKKDEEIVALILPRLISQEYVTE